MHNICFLKITLLVQMPIVYTSECLGFEVLSALVMNVASLLRYRAV
jgi:hypothetical protein